MTSKELEFHSTCAMLVQSEESIGASDFDITPTVVQYTYGRNGIIGAQITNVTTATFTIPPKAVLCELQHLQVDLNYKVSDSKDATNPLFDTIEMETIGLSEADVEKVKNLLMEHKDIFSIWDTDIGHCTFVQHHI